MFDDILEDENILKSWNPREHIDASMREFGFDPDTATDEERDKFIDEYLFGTPDARFETDEEE